MFRILILVLLFAYNTSYADGLDYPSIWHCDEEKFNWYCDIQETDKSSISEPPQPVSPIIQTPIKRLEIEDIKTAEQMRQEYERREDIASMNPTPENMKDLISLWLVIQEKGAIFSDNWRRVVWQNPELDYSLTRPVNNAAVKQYDSQRIIKEQSLLKELSKKHGLIYFFSSTCPYCKAMAPTLKTLSNQYGFEVLGVSIDGGALPEFPQPADGRTKAQKWGVTRVPALFIGSKETGDHAPIGFGMMALTDMLNRILVLTSSQPGDSF